MIHEKALYVKNNTRGKHLAYACSATNEQQITVVIPKNGRKEKIQPPQRVIGSETGKWFLFYIIWYAEWRGYTTRSWR
jgi:hypothetical protein